MTAATTRARLRAMLRRERGAWLSHLKEMKGYGRCGSDCQANNRWRTAHELILEALRATGARITSREEDAWTRSTVQKPRPSLGPPLNPTPA